MRELIFRRTLCKWAASLLNEKRPSFVSRSALQVQKSLAMTKLSRSKCKISFIRKDIDTAKRQQNSKCGPGFFEINCCYSEAMAMVAEENNITFSHRAWCGTDCLDFWGYTRHASSLFVTVKNRCLVKNFERFDHSTSQNAGYRLVTQRSIFFFGQI